MAQIQKIHGPEDLEQIRIHLNRSIEKLKEQQIKCSTLLEETSSFWDDYVIRSFLNDYEEGMQTLKHLFDWLERYDYVLHEWEEALDLYEEVKLEIFNDKEQ